MTRSLISPQIFILCSSFKLCQIHKQHPCVIHLCEPCKSCKLGVLCVCPFCMQWIRQYRRKGHNVHATLRITSDWIKSKQLPQLIFLHRLAEARVTLEMLVALYNWSLQLQDCKELIQQRSTVHPQLAEEGFRSADCLTKQHLTHSFSLLCSYSVLILVFSSRKMRWWTACMILLYWGQFSLFRLSVSNPH